MLPVPRVGASLSARPDAGFGGARVLGDVREGLGDHEVDGDLGRLGWPFVELHIYYGHAVGERPELQRVANQDRREGQDEDDNELGQASR